MQELIHQFGVELRYEDEDWMGALRQGAFLEHQFLGNRKYYTFGPSLGYKDVRFDAALLFGRAFWVQATTSTIPVGLFTWRLGLSYSVPLGS